MAERKQKSTKRPGALGRPPVSTSFKKGNKAALGNDKTTRVGTWIQSELSRQLEETDDYGEKIVVAQKMAKQVVDIVLTTKDPQVKLAYLKEVMDRTEGKPQAKVDVTSAGEKLEGLITNAQAEQLLRARANRTATEGDSD